MLPAPATHLAGAGRFPEGHWAGFRKVFGTGTPPTGTSVASSRGEGGFWTVFGTATLLKGHSAFSSKVAG